MSEDLNKIVERIRALLRMSADVSSEHEAGIAAERATRLMKKHNLEMADVIAEDIRNHDSSITDEDLSDLSYKRGFPSWVSRLAVLISRTFDCEVKFRRTTDNRLVLRIHGYKSDIEVARYVFMFLVERIQHFAWERWEREYLTHEANGHSGTTWKREYMSGMVDGLVNRIKEVFGKTEQTSSSTALVVLKSDMIKSKYGVFKYVSSEFDPSDAYFTGHQDSSKVKLNKGVTTDVGQMEELA